MTRDRHISLSYSIDKHHDWKEDEPLLALSLCPRVYLSPHQHVTMMITITFKGKMKAGSFSRVVLSAFFHSLNSSNEEIRSLTHKKWRERDRNPHTHTHTQSLKHNNNSTV